MDEPSRRMTKGGTAPSASQIAQWVGKGSYEYWKRVTQLIEQNYPGVFVPDWLYGGQKHGWSLRYKKGKSFCTFIPEKNHFALLIVLGAEERANVEGIRDQLSAQTQNVYDNATTYHDGKWVLLTVDSERIVKDVKELLTAKRKPKKGKET